MKIRIVLFAIFLAMVRTGAAGQSRLYASIRNNDRVSLKQLIHDFGVATKDADGNTPLMFAAAVGSVESMRLLLDAGADPNAVNKAGASPLMWCAGDAAKVKLLLTCGASVHAVAEAGRTPLHMTAYYDGSAEVARLLIAKGADVNARDKGGFSVLEVASQNNNLGVARLLLENNAAVNTADMLGQTPLHMAAGSGSQSGDLVRLLLAHGAKVNAPCLDAPMKVSNGDIRLGRLTPLHYAVTANYEAVKALVDAGADVNALDIRNETPLSLAVATDHADPKIVKLLLDRGARRASALKWARLYHNPAVLAVLGLPKERSKSNQASTSIPALREVAVTTANVRQAIARALPPCQSASATFLKKGGCISCHAQNLTGLAAYAAKPLAIQADYKLEQDQTRATVMGYTDTIQDMFQLSDPPGGVDQAVNALLQLMAADMQPGLLTDSIVHYISAGQRKEGDWPIASLVRPPFEDGSFSDTAKAIRVLRHYAAPALKSEMEKHIARGAHWLARAEPVSTEDRAMQILGLVWAGEKAPAGRVHQLVSKQREDGGWGQTDNQASDAYATGETLWALHLAGMAASNPIYQRGVRFLLRTQGQDGTWHVPTRALTFQPYFESGFPYGQDQWISQAGTTYAVIAVTFAAK
jgi:ankyrin repeat protein